MPAEILVTCPRCRTPQRVPSEVCAACGERLRVGELTAAPELPSMTGELGGGQRLLLFDTRLEWHPGVGPPAKVELARLEELRLERRPVWEALIFLAIFGLSAALVPWLWVRLVLAGAATLAVAACLTQKRYALVITSADGPSRVTLGIGSPGSPLGRRIGSVWSSVREELSRKGVRCVP